ncbi:MAG: class I SAM-dependent methyltransferase [Proteobacteria bacterium]|nr:class I SAM-dependent methyltransferase [Pseudomonadota bacterium]
MTSPRGNRFEDFFADDAYRVLKNFLYNYLLRKRAIGASLRGAEEGMTLEIGSGLSPTVAESENVVYSELSFSALRTLKSCQGMGFFVVADVTHLPFKTAAFTRVVCSEVMEHLPEDRPAFREMAAVLREGGSLILTFPHRHDYFACDDRFVNHYRRYELCEMEERLREAGLNPVEIRKVLGPLEKITMVLTTSAISDLQRMRGTVKGSGRQPGRVRMILPIFKWLNRLYCLPVRFDTWAMPRFLSAVLLIRSVKETRHLSAPDYHSQSKKFLQNVNIILTAKK